MHRRLPALLAALAVLLLLPAAGYAADTLGVQDGVLTYSADPASPGTDVRMGSMAAIPCEFTLPDGSTYRGGPCLVFAVDDEETVGRQRTGTVAVGPGCTAVTPDDAVCPLDGVSRVVLRGGPAKDAVTFGDVVSFARYSSLGTDEPMSLGVPVSVDLGAGDDQLMERHRAPDRRSPLTADIACGEGTDEVDVGDGPRIAFDCEGGGFRPYPAGTSGGSLRVDGGVARFVPPPAGEGLSNVLGVDRLRQAGHDLLAFEGANPQELGPGCIVLGSGEQACLAAGVERIEIVAPRHQAAGIYMTRTQDSPLPPTSVSLGDRADEVETKDGNAQHISCGGDLDKGAAGPEDTLEADCEDVKGGRRERGFDLGIGRRTVWRSELYRDLVPLTLTCPASIADDSCGGSVRLSFRGTRMGSIRYALAKGAGVRRAIAPGSGSVAIGRDYRRAVMALKAAIRRGGATVKLEVLTGASTFTHRVRLTRIVGR